MPDVLDISEREAIEAYLAQTSAKQRRVPTGAYTISVTDKRAPSRMHRYVVLPGMTEAEAKNHAPISASKKVIACPSTPAKRRGRPVDDERLHVVQRCIAAGMSYREIACKLDITEVAVRTYCHKHRLKLQAQALGSRKYQDRIRRLALLGLQRNRIAAAVGCSPGTVTNTIKRLGIVDRVMKARKQAQDDFRDLCSPNSCGGLNA